MTSIRAALVGDPQLAAEILPMAPRDRVRAVLTDVQRRFVDDSARYKLARCTRRAGKTYADAAYLILECLRAPGTPTLYAGLTRESAKEAVWQILIDMLHACQIDYTPHPSALRISFPNGSFIQLFGCDTENARNRLRGRKFKLVIFDETGFYSALDPLIYAIIPTLADLQGTLVLTSSPGELLQGFFYEADQGRFREKWSRYFWTIHDNPHFQQPSRNPAFATLAEEELATVLEFTFHGKASHPGYRREWLGEWVSDSTALVYPCGPQNVLAADAKLPMAEHAIGISITPFTFGLVALRYSAYSREAHIVESTVFEDYSLDRFAETLNQRMKHYGAHQAVADTGEYSAKITSELKRRYRLAVVAQDSKDKSFYQAVASTDLHSGLIKIAAGLAIHDEFSKIVKNSDGEEVDGQPNFLANAALAVYRRVYQTVLKGFERPLTVEESFIKRLEDTQYVDADAADDGKWYNQWH